MRRALVILLNAIIVGVIAWFFPLFHVVRVGSGERIKPVPTFNAVEAAESFWNSKLSPALAQAPDAAKVLTALRDDGRAARDRYGRKVGVSRTTLFVVQGRGKIVSINPQGIGVALDEGAQDANIVLKTGLVFGNIVRDSTGLFDPSSFSDSRQLNEISAELNRIVETRVVPTLKSAAKLDGRISFAACAEITDDAVRERPLAMIPLHVHVE